MCAVTPQGAGGMGSGIKATTRLFPIIGAPVAGVFSPPAFNAWFVASQIDCRMMALEIPVTGLAAFLEVIRQSPSLMGCSITYPHKQAAFSSVETLTDRAARLGAINTIRREADGKLHGDATDGEALCTAIIGRGGRIHGASVRVLGAGGGAGQAIIDALCSRGISRLVIEETDPTRKAQIEALLGKHWPDIAMTNTPSPVDILINASTIGKATDDPSPFEAASIEAAKVICDIATTNGVSQLIRQGAERGKITVTGDHMGQEQLPLQMDFIGFSPNADP